jgi:type IV secretory pathway VirB2 component (pilin)
MGDPPPLALATPQPSPGGISAFSGKCQHKTNRTTWQEIIPSFVNLKAVFTDNRAVARPFAATSNPRQLIRRKGATPMASRKLFCPPQRRAQAVRTAFVLAPLLLLPLVASAQASPFDTGFTAIETLFTGTVAKAASLIAIVIGGYGFAHGEPGAKKALAGVAAGTGIAVLAVNVLTWMWGV